MSPPLTEAPAPGPVGANANGGGITRRLVTMGQLYDDLREQSVQPSDLTAELVNCATPEPTEKDPLFWLLNPFGPSGAKLLSTAPLEKNAAEQQFRERLLNASIKELPEVDPVPFPFRELAVELSDTMNWPTAFCFQLVTEIVDDKQIPYDKSKRSKRELFEETEQGRELKKEVFDRAFDYFTDELDASLRIVQHVFTWAPRQSGGLNSPGEALYQIAHALVFKHGILNKYRNTFKELVSIDPATNFRAADVQNDTRQTLVFCLLKILQWHSTSRSTSTETPELVIIPLLEVLREMCIPKRTEPAGYTDLVHIMLLLVVDTLVPSKGGFDPGFWQFSADDVQKISNKLDAKEWPTLNNPLMASVHGVLLFAWSVFLMYHAEYRGGGTVLLGAHTNADNIERLVKEALDRQFLTVLSTNIVNGPFFAIEDFGRFTEDNQLQLLFVLDKLMFQFINLIQSDKFGYLARELRESAADFEPLCRIVASVCNLVAPKNCNCRFLEETDEAEMRYVHLTESWWDLLEMYFFGQLQDFASMIQLQSSSVFSALMDLLGAMSHGEKNSERAMQFLLSRNHLVQIDQYVQQVVRCHTQPIRGREMSKHEADILESIFRFYQVLLKSPNIRHREDIRIFDWAVLFVDLFCKRIPATLKAEILKTLVVFCEDWQMAQHILNLFEERQVLNTGAVSFPPDPNGAPNVAGGDLRRELENEARVPSPHYPLLRAFLSLMRQVVDDPQIILREQPGSGILPPVILPHLHFLRDTVLLKHTERMYATEDIRWEVVSCVIDIFQTILYKHPMLAEDFQDIRVEVNGVTRPADKSPAFDLLTNILRFRSPILGVVLGVLRQEPEMDPSSQSPAFNSAVRSALVFIHTVLVEEERLMTNEMQMALAHLGVESVVSLSDLLSNNSQDIGHICQYVRSSTADLQILAVNITNLLSSKDLSGALLGQTLSELSTFYQIRRKYVDLLEHHEPCEGLEDVMKLREGDPTTVSESILKLLLDNVDCPESITHLLLGYPGKDFSGLHRLAQLLCSNQPASFTLRGLELLYRLCVDDVLSIPTLTFLNNFRVKHGGRNVHFWQYQLKQLVDVSSLRLAVQGTLKDKKDTMSQWGWVLYGLSVMLHRRTDLRCTNIDLVNELLHENTTDDGQYTGQQRIRPVLELFQYMEIGNSDLTEHRDQAARVVQRELAKCNRSAAFASSPCYLDQEANLMNRDMLIHWKESFVQNEVDECIVDAIENYNEAQEVILAKDFAAQSWCVVVQIALDVLSSTENRVNNQNFLHDIVVGLLEVVLRSVAQCTMERVTAVASRLTLSLVERMLQLTLWRKGQSGANSDGYGTPSVSKGTFSAMLQHLIDITIQVPAEVRFFLYASLAHLLRFAEIMQFSKDPAQRNTILQRTQSVVELVSRDIVDESATSRLRSLAYTLLTVLIEYDANGRMLHTLGSRFYLQLFVQNISDPGLIAVLTQPQPKTYEALCEHEARFALLIKIAETRNGAMELMNNKLLQALLSFQHFDRARNSEVGTQAHTAHTPLVERQRRVFIPVLQLQLTLIMSLQRRPPLMKQIADFLSTNDSTVSIILENREQPGQVQAELALEELKLLVSLFVHLALSENADGHHRSQYSGSVGSKSIFAEIPRSAKYHELLVSLFVKFTVADPYTDARLNYIRSVVTNVLCTYCASRDPQVEGPIFEPSLQEVDFPAFASGGAGHVWTLGVLVSSLRRLIDVHQSSSQRKEVDEILISIQGSVENVVNILWKHLYFYLSEGGGANGSAGLDQFATPYVMPRDSKERLRDEQPWLLHDLQKLSHVVQHNENWNSNFVETLVCKIRDLIR